MRAEQSRHMEQDMHQEEVLTCVNVKVGHFVAQASDQKGKGK